MSKQDTNDPFKLARRITEIYLKESTHRFDAAERAARARRLVDKSGVTLETLESFYNDRHIEMAAEFLEEPGDHSFEHLFEFMERNHKERGETE